MCYWTGWTTIYKLALALVIGMLLFVLTLMRRKKNYRNVGLKTIFWIGPYLLGLVLISYFGSFGGNKMISFGWDFLVIGIFSAVMLHLAIAMRREYLPGEELVLSNEL